MKKYFTIAAALTLTAIAVVVYSCKRDEIDTETLSATDNSLCEAEFTRIFPEVNSLAINEEGVQRNGIPPIFQSLCPRDSVDPADTLDGFPVTLYMDYGTGCAGTDGKVRKGMIRAVFYQSWDNPVDTVIISLTESNTKALFG
jgi:hypothetical protein